MSTTPTPQLFGRDTRATQDHWKEIVASLGFAPRLCQGPLPRRSPENRRFRNPRYRGQLIGSCVGENTTAMVETLLRMPSDRTIHSTPLPSKDLSQLLTYWLARRWSFQRGIRLGREGAIVSHSILALNAHGLASYELYPATPANYRNYSDSRQPPQAALNEARQHPVKEYALLDSWTAILGALAAGYTVSIGVPIPQGVMRTDDTGRFHWRGRIVGGHCMELLDYDMDADLVWLGNSWANAGWGARSDDPVWSHSRGRTNIGHCSLTDLERAFSPRAMATGQSEAVVANTVAGWAPKIRSFREALK